MARAQSKVPVVADVAKSVSSRLVAVVAFTIGAFHLLNVSGLFVLSTPGVRIFHLLMMLVLLFLTKPSAKRLADNKVDRVVGVALVALAVASGVYLLTRWLDIALSGGETEPLDSAA